MWFDVTKVSSVDGLQAVNQGTGTALINQGQREVASNETQAATDQCARPRQRQNVVGNVQEYNSDTQQAR